jgi:hypothetical protein
MCVTMWGQRASMLVDEPLERGLSLTKGWQTKWEKEKKVHLDVIKELQKIEEFEDRPIEIKVLLVDLELAKLFT